MEVLENALLLFLFVFISGGSMLYAKYDQKKLKLLLAFSGAFLLGISVLHLLPEIYHSRVENIGLYILLGFFLQIVLEFLSEGIEHGHIHLHKKNSKNFPVVVMLSLSIHALLEGMPVSISEHSHHHDQEVLLWGIILHKIPVAIALTTMFLQSGLSKSRAMAWLFVFALMSPLGLLGTHLLGPGFLGDYETFISIVLALVLGMFLHISTTILFETSDNHKYNLLKLISILSGAFIAWIFV